jgi:hypothetical protein
LEQTIGHPLTYSLLQIRQVTGLLTHTLDFGGMTQDGRHFAASATGQHGYLTRRQANAGGATRAMLRSRVQSGDLERAGVRTFTSPLVSRTAIGELQALMLDIGDPVWASGQTAAALHGFDGFRLSAPFHVVLPHYRYVQRVGHVVHRSANLTLVDQSTAQGLAATSPTRTIIDLARSETSQRLTAALDSALRDGGSSESFLHRRISELRSSGRYGMPRLIDVIEGAELSRGGHSWLERRFLELVGRAGLPLPAVQAVLSRKQDRTIRVDCHFRGTPIVVELLGYRWHRTQQQMQTDAERMNRLQLEGYMVVQFTYTDIAERPLQTIESLLKALYSSSPRNLEQPFGRPST